MQKQEYYRIEPQNKKTLLSGEKITEITQAPAIAGFDLCPRGEDRVFECITSKNRVEVFSNQ